MDHVCAAALDASGYKRLYECDTWQLDDGGKYYTVRDGSSLIAFRMNKGSFMISASHSDSPCFRVKGTSQRGAYIRLDTEKYGGLINYTWLDRPLTVAGRVTVKSEGGISVRLADIGDRRVLIPSLAIHLNRTVNESCKLSPTSDLIPLGGISGDELMKIIANSVGADLEDILSHELFLTAADKPTEVGLSGELLLSPRLDDLSAVFASLSGFLSSESAECDTVPVLAVFDNEEVGSETKQGAASTFLYDTLLRISGGRESYLTRVASSFMVSADNAHACHPNHPELADAANAPTLGGGIAVKYNANQKYTTDAVSEAIFGAIASAAGVKVQKYFNRADMPGGSTLGSIADTKVSVATVDIGIPELAMHSANECCAVSDVADMASVMRSLFSSSLKIEGELIKLDTK